MLSAHVLQLKLDMLLSYEAFSQLNLPLKDAFVLTLFYIYSVYTLYLLYVYIAFVYLISIDP